MPAVVAPMAPRTATGGRPELPEALAFPVLPEVGLEVAPPASPLVAAAPLTEVASPLEPERAPVADEPVLLAPLAAMPRAPPFVVAAPERPLEPVSPLCAAVPDPAAPLPPLTEPAAEEPVLEVVPEPVSLLDFAAPVLPELPVLPLPAVPETVGLEVAAPVLPPFAVDVVVVLPVLPDLDAPVDDELAAPLEPPDA